MRKGLVEGFYGRPFEGGRRGILMGYLSALEDAAYVYAPKNDPFHRLRWREEYPANIWTGLAGDMALAASSGVLFFFGVSPWRFEDGEHGILRSKARRALDAGAAGIAVLFDDIPRRPDGNLAERQLELAAEALLTLDCSVLLCPTVYCLELLEKYRGHDYLEVWRSKAPGGWSSFWTGRSVVSRSFDDGSLRKAEELLGGRPVLWDNLLADDYCLRRTYLAGLEGRAPDGYGYFVNPPECFPAALHAVHSLLLASGTACGRPPELGGNAEAWELLASFHSTPWSAGKEASRMMDRLSGALEEGPDEGLQDCLKRAASLTGELLDELEDVPFGYELMPYARDLKRFLGFWTEALMLESGSARKALLRYLMQERLPFDHPLAAATAELAREGDR